MSESIANKTIEFFLKSRLTKKPTLPMNMVADRLLSESLHKSYLDNLNHHEKMDNLSKTSLIVRIRALSALSKLALSVFAILLISVPILILALTKQVGDAVDPTLAELNETPSLLSKLGGEVLFVDGEVSYSNDGSVWYQVETGQDISELFSYKTDTDSRLIINFDDGSAIRLDSNSEVYTASLNPDSIKIDLLYGSVYSRVTPLNRDFVVSTDSVNYISLGTAFMIEKGDKTQKLEVYESKVKALKEKEEFIIEEGMVFDTDLNTKDSEIRELTKDEVSSNEFVKWNRDRDKENSRYRDSLGFLDNIEPPKLDIFEPLDGSSTASTSVTVSGLTDPGIIVKVNDREVSVADDGSFQISIELVVGKNNIMIIAVDWDGNIAKSIVQVTRTTGTSQKQLPSTTDGLNLKGGISDYGMQFSWTIQNLDAPDGYKLVKSPSPNPTYGQGESVYISSSKRAYTWKLFDGKNYHFRVCRYIKLTNTCDNYSNEIKLQSKLMSDGVERIDLFTTDGVVKWMISGNTPDGIKVVWSLNPNPTYPNRTGDYNHYISDPLSVKTLKLSSFTLDEGKFYVRVCSFKSSTGSCSPYSNQVEITLPIVK